MANLKITKTLDSLLAQHGQDTSLKSKKNVWKVKGLDKRLGEYIGTPNQINVLINTLKENPFPGLSAFDPKNIPLNLSGNIKSMPTMMTTTPSTKLPVQSTIAPSQVIQTATQKTPQQVGGQTTQALKEMALPSGLKVTVDASGNVVSQQTASTQPPEATPPQVSPAQPQNIPTQTTIPTREQELSRIQSEINRITGEVKKKQEEALATKASTPTPTPTPTPFSASDTLKVLGITLPATPTVEEITKQVYGSPELTMFREKLGLKTTAEQAQAEVQKQKLDTQYTSDKNKLEQNLAQNGLVFSGIRASQVGSLAENLASSKLDIDRKMANALLTANLDLKEEIMKVTQNVIQKAQDGNKQAIEQLNKAGMAVIGNQIVPTLEAGRLSMSEQRLAIENERLKLQQEKALKTSELDSKTAVRVDKISGQFDNEPVVKRYNTTAEGYDFASNLNTSEISSSNDIGMIYAFAKAMDPDSVVREGEYATVQKYAQSWAEAFGFKAERIFSNQPFLTKQAKDNMVETIKQKHKTQEKTYNNVYNEYARRINNITGESDGRDYITDYKKAFSFGGRVDADLQSALQPGEILVKDKQGNIGAIPKGEFDPNLYERQ